MEPANSSKSSPPQPNRRKRDHSEWLEKALEEGGSRKRRSKKISDPDFVFGTKLVNKDQTQTSPSSTPDMDTESTISSSSYESGGVVNLDFNNMTHYEKFFKYKNEYKEYRMNRDKRRNERKLLNERKSLVASEVLARRSLRNSPRVQKIQEMAHSSEPNHIESDKSNLDEIDPESIEPLPPIEKDKYCWYCHKEVIESSDKTSVDEKRCKSCHKVFHLRCHPISSDIEQEDWECKACIELRELKDNDLWAPYVEYLGYDKYIKQIRYIIDNAKKYPSAKEFLTPVDTLRFPDYRQYIAHPVDFQGIERRLKNGEYRSVEILFEDFKWMLHNSVIFNGTYSAITKDFRGLLKYLRMDLYDLDSCACCYIHAYTRPDAWFILPCPSPHLLVWAQLKGFPHWPAKVYDSHLEQRPGEILVKFFGDHARSWIPYEHIYLYSLDPPSSGSTVRTKKKQNMIPSLVEMETHVELLKKQFGEFKYPEQNVLIGRTVQERALQLKSMIPSCTSCLLKQPCALKQATAARASETIAPVPEPEANPDTSDTISKRNLLSRLEERLQQGCSDSEESVKSSRETNRKPLPSKSRSKALRGVRCRLFFKVLQKNAFKIQDERLENMKKNRRTQIKSANSPAVRNIVSIEKTTVQIDGSNETVTNQENLIFSLDSNDSLSTNTEMNPNEDTHENTTKPNGTAQVRVVKNTDHVESVQETSTSVESSVSSRTVSLPEDNNKPNCKNIDDFIENHLASSQQTCEWNETNKIPPILTPRVERVLPVAKTITEEKPDEINETNEISTILTPREEKVVAVSRKFITEENPDDPSSKVEGNHEDEKNDSTQTDEPSGKVESQQENEKNDKTHKNKKKRIVNKRSKSKERMLLNKSLNLKERLFRFKNYGAQLFEIRKLSQVTSDETSKRRRDFSDSLKNEPPVGGNVSNRFEMKGYVKILDPLVVLCNLTISEIKGLKSIVKINKNLKSSMNLRKRTNSVDSGFVPIEDTMRITSTEYNDVSCDLEEPSVPENGLTTVIDQVAKGGLASDLKFERLLKNRRQRPFRFIGHPKSQSKERKVSGNSASGSSPALPSASPSGDETNKKLNSQYQSDEDNSKVNSQYQSKDAIWTHHMSQLMKFLVTNPSMLTGKKAESMIADVEKLNKLTQTFSGENKDISEDIKFSTALNSAELILYAEYAAEYDLPELTSADYDEEYNDI